MPFNLKVSDYTQKRCRKEKFQKVQLLKSANVFPLSSSPEKRVRKLDYRSSVGKYNDLCRPKILFSLALYPNLYGRNVLPPVESVP